ncbi:MAG: GIY-YIG nuclease family protein [Elusimicrobia bacterium]|nr:GIY-YIG nuclease family protein [Elusimicrobiota bacterium]
MWYVYILECPDGRLYTGITTDLKRRLAQHQKGTGAKFTRAFGVRRLVHNEKYPSRSAALKREAVIKNLSRLQKERLFL